MVKYELNVIEIPHEMMPDFKTFRTLIFFDEAAPPELKEISISHNNSGLNVDVVKGDSIFFDDVEAKILDVGELANKNIKELGHLVILFQDSNESEVDLPGQILCAKIEFPNIQLGTKVTIKGE